MKTEFLKYGLYILLLGYILGCDDYEQKIIERKIYVDKPALSLFVGQTVQLHASPADGTYQYHWSSEDPSVATVTSSGLVEVIGEGFTNIVVSNGDLFTKVPLTAVERIPLEDVLVSDTLVELTPGAKKTVLIFYIPENVNDLPSYSWKSGDPSIATVNIAGEIVGIDEGVTTVYYQIGDIVKKIKVDVAYTRPFKGPHILSAKTPYLLPAANFDFGGEGYAFHDQDAHNQIGNDNYRRSNGDNQSTPVEVEGDGINIGYTNPGEWLLYTIEVIDEGDYLVEAEVAVPGTSSFHIEVDGVNVTGTIEVPNTGSWGNYTWVSTPEEKLTLSLTKGRHKIKYYFESGHNFRSLRFTKM